MNNIYLDELPDCCGECPYRYEQCGILNYCNVFDDGLAFISDQTLKKGRLKSCPLKLLSTRLAEERKRVVDLIKAQFEPSPDSTVIEGTPTPEAELVNRGFRACKKRFYDIFDRIERGDDTNVATKNN